MPADAPATQRPARLRPTAVHLEVLTRGPGRSRKARDLVTDLVFAAGRPAARVVRRHPLPPLGRRIPLHRHHRSSLPPPVDRAAW